MSGVLRRLERRLDFDARRRERIWLKLAAYLRSGVRLPDALEMLHRHQTLDGRRTRTTAARAIADWRRRVANGRSFGAAVEGWVPFGEAVLIRAGDESGRLDVALTDAVAISKARRRMVGAVWGGLAYPLLLLVLMGVFCGLFALMVVPNFAEVWPRERWEGYPALLADAADAVVAFGPWVLAVFVGVLVLALVSLPRWVSPLRARLEGVPPWSIHRTLEGAGFLLSLGALIKAGMKLPDALRVMAQSGSPWLRHRILAAHRHVQNGLSLGDALHRTGHGFPHPEVVLDLRSYSNMDDFDRMLDMIAREWIEESVERIRSAFDQIKNGLIIVFGFLFIAIAVGIFMLQDMITKGVSSGL